MAPADLLRQNSPARIRSGPKLVICANDQPSCPEQSVILVTQACPERASEQSAIEQTASPGCTQKHSEGIFSAISHFTRAILYIVSRYTAIDWRAECVLEQEQTSGFAKWGLPKDPRLSVPH
jgi:hypothetical protein